MDLVLHDYLSAMTMLILLTGKRDASCWETWINSYLSLDENYQILNTFGHPEEESISTSNVDGRKTLSVILSLEGKGWSVVTYLATSQVPRTPSTLVYGWNSHGWV